MIRSIIETNRRLERHAAAEGIEVTQSETFRTVGRWMGWEAGMKLSDSIDAFGRSMKRLARELPEMG